MAEHEAIPPIGPLTLDQIDRITLAASAPRPDDNRAWAERAEALVVERMAFYGYTPEQIEDAAHYVDHYAAGCVLAGIGQWDCEDEDGRPLHLIHDEYDRTAEFVVWVMERVTETDSGAS